MEREVVPDAAARDPQRAQLRPDRLEIVLGNNPAACCREPDENRYDIETGKLDSASVRLSYNPTRAWALLKW